MTLELNTDQRAAVDACAQSIRDRAPVTRLFGYAGTGKTTIASTVVEEAGLDMYRVQFAAPTGKAAAVLARKLKAYGIGAKTIHSLLYQPPKKVTVCKACGAEDSAINGKCINCGKPFVARAGKDVFRWTLDDAKTEAAENLDLLVVDEASMIGTKLGNDIMYLGVPVLAIGDPMQLQPINDKRFFMEEAPTAQLEQIMRSGNDVLPLAQDIRRNGLRAINRYRDINLGQIGQSHALDYSQIIVGKNRTRDLKNRKMRELHGYAGDMPMVGERIICLRNNYGLGCLNGQQFTITEIHDEQSEYWKAQGMFIAYLKCDCGAAYDITSRCTICGWASNRLMPIWLKGFTGHAGERELADMRYQDGNRAMMATYGYCITAHKSQGSEWPSVLVINEAWGKEAVNWLYTAVTRAKNEVAIIRGR